MTNSDTKAVTAFFDQMAREWDTMRLDYYDERVIDHLADVSDLTKAATVADIGTGTGFVAAGLGPRVGHVIGVDGSAEMLAVARRNLADLAIGNVELRQGDIVALPLDDDSVDAAVANMVLHHAPEPSAMLAEMRRVVRPGGIVAICDEVEHPYEWMRTEHADVWLGFSEEDVHRHFTEAGLGTPSIQTLGMQ